MPFDDAHSCLIARMAVRQLLCGPSHEVFAGLGEVVGQVLGLVQRADDGLLLRTDVQVHQRQFNLRQAHLQAHQCAIYLGLSPVQISGVVGQGVQWAFCAS